MTKSPENTLAPIDKHHETEYSEKIGCYAQCLPIGASVKEKYRRKQQQSYWQNQNKKPK